MSEIKLNKVNITDGGSIKVDYIELEGIRRNHHTVASTDFPENEFYQALAALKDVALDILQLKNMPQKYSNKLSVYGVSFFYDPYDTMGAKIHCKLHLYKTKEEVKFDTPKRMSKDQFAFEDDIYLTEEAEDKLNKLKEVTIRYLKSITSQIPLFRLDDNGNVEEPIKKESEITEDDKSSTIHKCKIIDIGTLKSINDLPN